MISAGEKGGLLAEIMARLATYWKIRALRKEVKTALMYPTAVTVVPSHTIFLLVNVIPTSRIL